MAFTDIEAAWFWFITAYEARLFIDHLRVLNFYGKRGSPPDPRRPKEQKAYTIWHDALARIEPALQSKGILQ